MLPIGVSQECRRFVDMYQQAKAIRSPYEPDWRRVSELAMPRHYGLWASSAGNGMAGASRESRAVAFDSTMARSIPKFGAICERLLTPASQIYHQLRPSDRRLLKSRAVREYYEEYNNLLFDLRYHPRARFSATQGELYQSMAAYGNGCKMVTWRGAGINGKMHRNGRGSDKGGFLYRTIPFRNMFWFVDEEEQTNLWLRRIDWTARQAMNALKENTPKKVKEVADKNSQSDLNRTFEFFQVVMPAEEYEPGAMDYRRFEWTSLYLYAEDPEIVVKPSGYHSVPFITPRHFTEGGSPYGYGSAQQVLSTAGTVNAQVKTILKVGQKKADPPLLAREDGIMNGLDQRPAAVNYGAVNAAGQKLVHTLDVGNIDIAEKLLQQQQYDIEDAFFVTLFKQLKDRPQMTATEVLQMAADTAAMLSPTMGRLQAEDLGPQIEREIDLVEQAGLAPEKPAEVKENPEYDIIYTSPLAKAGRSEQTMGFFRLVEMAGNYAKLTGNTKAIKRLNVDRALPEIADQQNVPASWISTDEEVAAQEAAEAQDKQTQTMVDVAPAAASLVKSGMTPNKAA